MAADEKSARYGGSISLGRSELYMTRRGESVLLYDLGQIVVSEFQGHFTSIPSLYGDKPLHTPEATGDQTRGRHPSTNTYTTVYCSIAVKERSTTALARSSSSQEAQVLTPLAHSGHTIILAAFIIVVSTVSIH